MHGELAPDSAGYAACHCLSAPPIKVCVDLGRHRTTRFAWILMLAFVFVTVGIVHDAYVPSYASALWRDEPIATLRQEWDLLVASWCRTVEPTSPIVVGEIQQVMLYTCGGR